MRRSLSKEGVRHPLDLENFEFSHSLGQNRTLGIIAHRKDFATRMTLN